MKIFFNFVTLLFFTQSIFAKINIVTTTETLADIVKTVGGDKVTVISLSRGTQDPHFVEPRPSMVVSVKNADLLVCVGMDLDIWVESLINASRNEKVMFGKQCYCDVSVGIKKLDVPEGKIDGRVGHVHPQGNPHYWLDPVNIKIVAETIYDKLSELSPENKNYFTTNVVELCNKIDTKLIEWKEKLNSLDNKNIITYHKSWTYFAERFGLNIVTELEPKPGIPPSAKHLSKVIKSIRENNVAIILKENFYPDKPAMFVSKKTGAKIVNVPNSVGGTKDVKDYFLLIDVIVNELVTSKK